jgi:hypothetical protein
MRLTITFALGLTIAALAMASAPAKAENSPRAKACLEKCRTDLKRAGTWSSYPKGYCRGKCDAPRSN